jgi:UDP-N-acetylmuramoyl-L-alanyl-D-glutamate--2,6-diaminopimelate ligase
MLAGVAVLRADGPLDIPVAGLAHDSRKVVPGGLFVAIKGYHTDGHAYVEQAVARGAAAVVVDAREWDEPTPDGVTLVVALDSRVALAPLAAAFYGYPASRLLTIGITGTKGKSTTTDLTSQVLDGCGLSTGLISTVDFKIGQRRWANTTRQSTPEAPEIQELLAAMVADGCDTAVIEATSHALSARWNRLGGSLFDVAVFLNITHEHLDYHGSFEQYRADKARLFELLGERAPGAGPRRGPLWAIGNADDPSCPVFLAAAPPTARRLTFGLREPADVRARDVVAGPSGARFSVDSPWGSAAVRLQLPGLFNVSNALAALTVALSQGAKVEQAAAALATARGPRGRMEPVVMGQPFDVIVDYAHNPDSFAQVLGMMRPLTRGRMIAVFGSAGERDVAKRPIQGEIAARYCDLLVLTDEDPRGEDRLAIIEQIAEGAERAGRRRDDGYRIVPDRAAAVAEAIGAAREGDLVLLLGKGHEGNIIYADHSLTWNEAAEARSALVALGFKGE